MTHDELVSSILDEVRGREISTLDHAIRTAIGIYRQGLSALDSGTGGQEPMAWQPPVEVQVEDFLDTFTDTLREEYELEAGQTLHWQCLFNSLKKTLGPELSRLYASASTEPKVVTITDEFSVMLKPTRTGFKHPFDEGKMLRLWTGETSQGQELALLSFGAFCEGGMVGWDYTPVNTGALSECPRDLNDRIAAVNALSKEQSDGE